MRRGNYFGSLGGEKHTKWRQVSQKTMMELLCEGKLNNQRVSAMMTQHPKKVKQALKNMVSSLNLSNPADMSRLREIIKCFPNLME